MTGMPTPKEWKEWRRKARANARALDRQLARKTDVVAVQTALEKRLTRIERKLQLSK